MQGEVAEVFDAAPDDVTVGLGAGLVLPQLAAGRFEAVTAEVRGLGFGEIGADLELRLEGVPVDRSRPIEDVSGALSVPADSLAPLVAEITGFPVETVGTADGRITVGTTLDLGPLGSLPTSIELEPSASSSSIILRPTAILAGGTRVAVDDIRSIPLVGEAVAPLVAGGEFCVADRIPAALALTAFRVDGSELRVEFSGTQVALSDLRTRGTCA